MSPAPPDESPGRRPYGWLTGLIIVMTVVALLAAGLALHSIEARLVATTGESLSLAAADIADKLDRFLFERSGDARMMALAFTGHLDDRDYLANYLLWMKQAYGVYLWLGVADAQGRMVAATDPATLALDVGQRDWFLAARTGAAVVLGDVGPYEAAGGVDSVAVAAAITGPDGRFAGVVMSRTGLPAVEGVVTRTIRAFQAREGFLGTVEYQFLTREGVAFVDSDLAHKGNINLLAMGLPSARLALADAGEPGYVEEEHLRRHVRVLTGYARSQGQGEGGGLGWGVLVRMDEADILEPIRGVLLKLVVAGAVVWGPMFALLLWAVPRLRREYAQARQESARAREAEATVREGARRLRARHATTQVLAEAQTMKEAGARILQAICESLDWELGSLWVVDEPARVLRCVELWHEPLLRPGEFEAVTRQGTFAPGIGLPGRVWQSGEPAWIPDVVTDRNFPRAPAAARAGLHAAFGFPIRVRGQVRGVFEFFSHEIRPPDEDLLLMLADIGGKIGQFIEHRQLEEQFRQVQKMEAIGQLAGGIAHDFNNLLTVINGYTQILLGRLPHSHPLAADVGEIQKAGARAAVLTQQLLAFSRRQVLQSKVLDLNQVVAGLESMLRRLIGEHITLSAGLAPGLGRVKADPGQVEQVLLNLVVNARDAMPDGGRLTITTADVELADQDLLFSDLGAGAAPGPRAARAGMPPGRPHVALTVTDTGRGIDPQVRDRIFEPFFTTKERGRGTGLGLSTVYGIVQQSGGRILVESEPGRGATFTIYLPRVEAEPAVEASEGRAPGAARGGSETILLAEDEDMIRTMVSQELRSQGYRVLEAPDGTEAVRLGAASREPIHLLVTDIVMPGLSGREVAERLAAAHPEMRVLYMSGYTDDSLVRGDGDLMKKPFMPADLVRRVREILDRPAA